MIARIIKIGAQIISGISVKWNVAVQSPDTIIRTPTATASVPKRQDESKVLPA